MTSLLVREVVKQTPGRYVVLSTLRIPRRNAYGGNVCNGHNRIVVRKSVLLPNAVAPGSVGLGRTHVVLSRVRPSKNLTQVFGTLGMS